jgi:hypothetical protein
VNGPQPTGGPKRTILCGGTVGSRAGVNRGATPSNCLPRVAIFDT